MQVWDFDAIDAVNGLYTLLVSRLRLGLNAIK